MKTKIRLTLLAVLAIGGFVVANGTFTKHHESDIVLDNIEALSRAETETTWTCVGYNKACNIKCNLCGTEIGSEGTLEGYHKCNY